MHIGCRGASNLTRQKDKKIADYNICIYMNGPTTDLSNLISSRGYYLVIEVSKILNPQPKG